MTVGAQV